MLSVELIDGERGERMGEEPNHTTKTKPGTLEIIQYSLEKTNKKEAKKMEE